MIVSIFDSLYQSRLRPWCFTAEVLIRGEENHEIEARTDFMGLSADKDRIVAGDGVYVIQG